MMPVDVAHYARATELIMAPTVLSPRSVLVHCTIARSESGAPIQGNVWLALQPMLRTPVLCVKPANNPIENIFLKTLETPERDSDASGCGWHLVCKTRVHGAEEYTRRYPISHDFGCVKPHGGE